MTRHHMRPVPERYTDKKVKMFAVNSDASIFQMYPIIYKIMQPHILSISWSEIA
jgi:hypothetical protein